MFAPRQAEPGRLSTAMPGVRPRRRHLGAKCSQHGAVDICTGPYRGGTTASSICRPVANDNHMSFDQYRERGPMAREGQIERGWPSPHQAFAAAPGTCPNHGGIRIPVSRLWPWFRLLAPGGQPAKDVVDLG